MTPSPNPEKIGRYQILERVGRGGMGVLLRGIDPVLDREVAIKLMLVDFSEDAEQMRPRFYREARAAARLQHPNIVTVFEFAEDNNTPYIVMEFLRGSSLQARMASPIPLALDEKLHVIVQLCNALNYAHEQGVIHRDIKPANIFLLADGAVKLLDFGIAKLATSTMTRQGDVLGSAMYMSPEQVSGSESVDGRSDIFSVGIVLYELLANRKPFQAETLTATVMKLLRDDPPALDEVIPGLPQQLVAAVNKALAKEPANRFQTAGDFAKELQWIRQALQASSQGPVSLEETRFATPAEVQKFQRGVDDDLTIAALGQGAQSGGEKSVTAAASGRKRVALASIAAVVVIAGAAAAFAMWGREVASGATSPAAAVAAPSPADAARTPRETLPAAATPLESSLQIDTTPAGVAVSVDGRDTKKITPASVTLSGAGPHRLRLSKAGFVAQEIELVDADVRSGSVSYKLTPAEAVIVAVTVDSGYPVEVWNGSQLIGPAGEAHNLKVPQGANLRITAEKYLFAASMRAAGKPIVYHAPALGQLTVLTRHETCNVKIGEHVLGFPPITRLPIAAGQYRVDTECPSGENPPAQVVTITPNQTTTARIY